MTIIHKSSNLCFPTLLAVFTTGLTSGISSPTLAQVTSDGTTGTSVNINRNDYRILNGTNQSNNLFHSFSNFSLQIGKIATFDLTNTPNITTIFSRVTGGNISHIDGLIRTVNNNNPISLFLMNPAGFFFGLNASLNIGGSFVGTTARSIKFADGVEFSVANPGVPQLLTISVPIGLQMGQNPGGITVQGSGHRLTGGFFTPINSSNNSTGLQVKAGNTLALIGGEVNFSGGIVAANRSGHLEVGSVSDGQVGLNTTATGWVGNYSAVQQFKDIHLAEQSLLNASGTSASIQVQGRNINLSEGSAILSQSLGAQASNGITIKATESLNLTGNVTNGRTGSFIQSNNLGTGQMGDITISAGQLSIQNGGQISTGIFTQGSGGNITVNVADSIFLDGFTPSNPRSSSLTTNTFSSSKAGDITVSSGNLKLLNGASLSSLTLGTGQVGTVRVNAKDLIEIVGTNPITLGSSAISSANVGFGSGNNTFINTSRLLVRDGGGLGSTTVGRGNAGNVVINASKSVEISGTAGAMKPSRIAAIVQVLDPATQALIRLPAIPIGDAGSLTINTPSLRITDGAYATVRNEGLGKAGNLQINANSIFLDNHGNITASTASGNGGDVRLNLQSNLVMRHNSLISATASSNGNGGNLFINSPVIVGLENSDIIANAFTDNGGNINITTQGIFGLKFRNQVTPENDITASSQFGLSGRVQVNTIGVDPNSGLVELPANVTDPSQQIATGCAGSEGSRFVATGRGGVPPNPLQQVTSDVYDGLHLRTWSDIRDSSAYRKTGEVTAQMPQSPEVLIQATSWHRNAQGKIELVADKPSTQVQQPLTCAAVTKI